MDRPVSFVRGSHSPPAAEACRPAWEAISPASYFDPQTVVSRDALGQPVSLYGCDSWDYRTYTTDGASAATLHFFAPSGDRANPRLASIIREQHKALVWLYIDAGKMKALGTIREANHVARQWCRRACARGVDLFALLSNPGWVDEELPSLSVPYVARTSQLIITLCRNREALRVTHPIPLQELKALARQEMKARDGRRQTPLIPSRIYCAILAGLLAKLDEIERDVDDVLDAYRQSKAASRNAPSDGTAMQRLWFRTKALDSVVERMRAFGYDPSSGGALNRFIAGRINFFQSVLMHTVAAFTGMRWGEVRILPLHDLETFEDYRGVHHLVSGYTYKLNRGVKKETTWVTSREGHRAVRLALRIGRVILEEVGGQPSPGQETLLFPSTESPFRAKGNVSKNSSQRRLAEAICPVIMQADINELDRLELDRGWQREGIVVGSRWPLAFHQLRRSLSVYAHRSGMVSLPALKGQLQHITNEMRAYYADGYSRAVNLVFDKDHFSHEWKAAKGESSYFGYVLGIVFSDDDLMGRGVERMAATVSSHSRQETLRLFERGELAYRETVLGGCASTEECKTRPLEPIPFDCLKSNCVNQIVFSRRLDHVIRSQETVVMTLGRSEPGSVEHRLEADHLRVLFRAREQFKEGKS